MSDRFAKTMSQRILWITTGGREPHASLKAVLGALDPQDVQATSILHIGPDRLVSIRTRLNGNRGGPSTSHWVEHLILDEPQQAPANQVLLQQLADAVLVLDHPSVRRAEARASVRRLLESASRTPVVIQCNPASERDENFWSEVSVGSRDRVHTVSDVFECPQSSLRSCLDLLESRLQATLPEKRAAYSTRVLTQSQTASLRALLASPPIENRGVLKRLWSWLSLAAFKRDSVLRDPELHDH